MGTYDLAIAWNWEYDAPFIRCLDAIFQSRACSLFQITPQNLDEVLAAHAAGQVRWQVFLDRASDSDPRFQSLAGATQAVGGHCINPQAKARWAADKATMHLEFLTAGIETPYTIILPPARQQEQIEALDLTPLGRAFAIKPAIGGGGEGVVLEATHWDQVLASRWQLPEEKYLLQAHVDPVILEDRPAWFRVIYCHGAVFPCWWHPKTHLYTRLDAEARFRLGLHPLMELPRRIAALCALDLFSTEIALTQERHFVVVDHVNDPVDLRLNSLAVDGVPDEIVERIAMQLLLLTCAHLRPRNE